MKNAVECDQSCFQSRPVQKYERRGLQSTEVAFLLLTQRPQVQFSVFPKIYLNVAEIYQWRWLEERGQRLENRSSTS